MRLMCFLLLLLLPSWLQASPAAHYTIHALDGLTPPRSGHLGDLVVGVRLVTGHPHAFVLAPTVQDLGLLPEGDSASPDGVEGAQVVGEGTTGPGAQQTHAWRWTPAQGMQALPLVAAVELFSSATGVNTTSAAGYGETRLGNGVQPLRWTDVSRTPEVLTTLDGGQGYVTALAPDGTAVGASRVASGRFHAAVWPPTGGVQDVQTLAARSSLALDVNATGQVVGTLETDQGVRGFRWTGATGMEVLPPLPGGQASKTSAINDQGDSVGVSYAALPGPVDLRVDQPPPQDAVLWDGLTPVALLPRVTNGTGWVLLGASGISNAGLIAGIGRYQGQPALFLLMPEVPPPAPVAPRQEPRPAPRQEPRRR